MLFRSLKDYTDEAQVKEYRDLAHKIGLTQKQAEALWDINNARVGQGLEAMAEASQKERDAAEQALRSKWGTAYDDRLNLANQMIRDNVPDEESRQKLVEAVGNSPQVAEFLANIGLKFIEHKVIPDSAGRMPTPDDMKLKIAEAMKNPAYTNPHDPTHKIVVAEVQRLFEEQARIKGTAAKAP